MNKSEYLEVAIEAAKEAGKVLDNYYQEEVKIIEKTSHTDYATEADLESDKVIRKIINSAFPAHNMITEEDHALDQNSEFTWVVDPLDGTIPFTRGIPNFAVSIGLLKNNQPYLGVVNKVGTNDLYYAQIGNGAYLNDQPIRVSDISDLNEATIGIEFGYKERVNEFHEFFAPLVDEVRFPFCFGGTAATLGLLAEGKIDAYIHTAFIWDFAGGAPIVLEAGGQLNKIDWTNKWMSVLASNGKLHSQLVQRINKGESKE